MSKPSYARVIIDRSIHRELDYLVPELLAEKVSIGSRVRVPFREKSALATVVALLEEADAEGIRPIEALVGDRPALSPKLIELARWMSAYYCCPIETVMSSLLPQVIRKAEVTWKKQLFVTRAKEIAPDEIDKLRRRAPRQAKPLLLHGVTGSGKTEIYLQAIHSTLARGRTAIVLVPEISLTPQTVERFKSRFAEAQDTVAVLHSHLSEGERHDEWHKIQSGRARIVVVARSAVFAPLENLGLIVVDEEHETSYKQEE